MNIQTVNDVITSKVLANDRHLLFQTNINECRFYELYSYLRQYYVRVTNTKEMKSRFFKLVLTDLEKEKLNGYYTIISLLDISFFC